MCSHESFLCALKLCQFIFHLSSLGGKEIRIWDAFSRSLLTKCGQYHKTVTSLCLCKNGKRLITGSLDQRVKIFDLVSYKVVHTMTYKSPILSVACSVSEQTSPIYKFAYFQIANAAPHNMFFVFRMIIKRL